MTISTTFFRNGQYSQEIGPKNYLAPATVTDYVVRATLLLNKIVDGIKVVTVTNDTTTDALDDFIIAEYALHFADLDFKTRQYDPETKKYLNPHWGNAEQMLLLVYGVRDSRGKVVLPNQFEDYKALGEFGRADVTEGV